MCPSRADNVKTDLTKIQPVGNVVVTLSDCWVISTAMKWLYSGVLSAKINSCNIQLLLDAETKQFCSTMCAADS